MDRIKKLTKEGWLEWLEEKAGPEMIFAVIAGLMDDTDKMIDSIFEYINE